MFLMVPHVLKIIRTWAHRYGHIWWYPGTVSLAALALLVLLSCLPPWPLIGVLDRSVTTLLGVSLLGLLAAGLNHLIKRRWLAGIFQLFLVIAIPLAIAGAGFLLMLYAMSGPSEDNFAKNLKFPPNVPLIAPLEQDAESPGGSDDSFQTAVLATLATAGNDDPTVTANIPSLAKLQKDSPEILRRYLATSIAWRVFEEGGKLFATRRWKIGDHWSYSLHGYYTRSSLDPFHDESAPDFQSRLTLFFSNKPWANSLLRDDTTLKVGQSVQVGTTIGNTQPSSLSILKLDGVGVEIFEQSATRERRITKAALAYLERELRPLADAPSWETIQSIVPPGSIIIGESSLHLRNSFQPGIYTSEIRVNPGEPGRIYLKAFEITRDTPLSVSRLEESSNEFVGWSTDPRQQFFSNTNFTIYEGDWGHPYAARFEVWFVPDSGQRERKLIEQNFRIEGWQR